MSATRPSNHRLVLFEGLPGSGKSTTAQWLCHLLEARGVTAAWYHEQDAHHPVYNYEELQAATRSGPAACEAYHAAARYRWRELATSAAGVTILDSSFLQSPITSMLLAASGRDAIASHIAETEGIVASLAPLLIVLRHADPPEALEYLRASRGPWFDAFMRDIVRDTPYTFLDLLRDHAVMLDGLVPGVEMPALHLDVRTLGWTGCRRAIADVFGLTAIDIHPAAADPARFTGRYRDADSDQELVVAADGRGLFLEATGTRLLPRRGATFELEGLSIELTFENGTRPDGVAERMRCAARLPNIGPLWVRTA
jgi:thymidylate kinase